MVLQAAGTIVIRAFEIDRATFTQLCTQLIFIPFARHIGGSRTIHRLLLLDLYVTMALRENLLDTIIVASWSSQRGRCLLETHCATLDLSFLRIVKDYSIYTYWAWNTPDSADI